MIRYLFLLCAFFSLRSNPVSDAYLNVKYLKAIIGSTIGSDYQFELLGTQEASEEIQSRVTALKRRLCIAEDISIRKMNDNAKKLFGKRNCFATHNAIFVNEEWLDELTDKHKDVVLAHELDHIKSKDAFAQLAVKVSTWFMFVAFCYYMRLNELVLTLGVPIFLLIIPILQATFKRYTEKRSDRTAAQIVGEQATIDYLEDRFDSSDISTRLGWLASWFEFYPSKEERIAFVKKDT